MALKAEDKREQVALEGTDLRDRLIFLLLDK
jgi:hypothetical protein